MKNLVLLLLMPTLFCMACQTETKKGAATITVEDTTTVTKAPDGSTAKNSLDVAGTYKGVVPCADCEGIETSITLQLDSTFSMDTKYLGKPGKAINASGKWSWVDGFTIALDGIKHAPNKYFVGENTLVQLDVNGKKITGTLADKYQLNKQ